MRFPYEYWLKYLLVSAQTSTEQIRTLCTLYQLPEPPDDYLSTLRVELGGRRHVTDLRQLRHLQIKALATNDKYAVAARELLTNFRIRPILEVLIISGMSPENVSMHVEGLTQQVIPANTIAMYKHYFWNPDLLSNQDWETFLEKYPKHHATKLRHSLLRGEEHALWKLGYSKELDARGVVQGIMYESAMRFKELNSYGNGQDTALAAKMWAENVFKAAEFLSRDEDAVKSALHDLSQFAMRLGRREISSINTLTNKPGDTE